MSRYANVIPDPIATEKSGYSLNLTEQDLIRMLIDSSESKQEYHQN